MNKRFLFLTIFLITALGLISYKITHAFFSDTASSTGNIFAASTLFPTPTTTPTPTITVTPTVTITPSPTPSIVINLVINEVYYDPDSDHIQGGGPNSDENDFEWIEIYNPTGSTVNLKDWKIIDNSGVEKSISTSNRDLAAGNFVVLAKAANVKTLWGVAEDKFIPIGENFGNGLANNGDRVILKDNNGATIDSMSYGDDISQLNPSAPDVIEGHSLERNPDGTDSDTNADFVDRSTPTPGT